MPPQENFEIQRPGNAIFGIVYLNIQTRRNVKWQVFLVVTTIFPTFCQLGALINTYRLSTLNVLQKLDVCCKGISGWKLKPPIPRLRRQCTKSSVKASICTKYTYHLGPPKLYSSSFETPFMKSRTPVKEIFSTMGLFTTLLLAFSCRAI